MANSIVNEYNPEFVSYPGMTLSDILEEKGWTQKEFALRMGRPMNKVNEIIKGKIAITPLTALQLERVLGIPASFWNTRQKQFDEYKAFKKEEELLQKHLSWLKIFPIKEMIKNKWIRKQKDDTTQLKELLSFFGISSPDEWNAIWMSPKVAYKQSSAFNKKPEANSVWLRRGEVLSQNMALDTFSSKKFIQSLFTIRDLIQTLPENFADQMVDLCGKAGVALVFVPRPEGLPVYGITKWITKDKALIQLSLYRKYEDFFWFAFFHEAAHILLHGKSDIFIETRARIENEAELEADSWASNFLLPERAWKEFVSSENNFTEASVMDYAARNKICPGIIVGRLQKEKFINYNQLNHLRRKFDFN